MPKIKSHRGAGKRFRVTGKGKVKYKKPGLRHLLVGMSATRGRHLRKAGYLNPVDGKIIKTLIPYN
ncbi:MAG: 50S ribosomal protein L35 [Elusimicrobia bacterium RIFCSPLOWO2_01_FULL_59_12]|nr:MAG: 50S ribosomal protein L35 [Elusimicrobia bacterium RIFCSPLOWO2_01_FULL_59_12]